MRRLSNFFDFLRRDVADVSPAEIEKFISEIIERTDDIYFGQKGKNFYITNEAEHIRITVNSNTYRLITADKI